MEQRLSAESKPARQRLLDRRSVGHSHWDRAEETEQREEQRQAEARRAAGQVRAPEEAALAAQRAGGRQHHRLPPAEAVGVVPVLHGHRDHLAGAEVHLDPPVQLPERRQRRGPHPHHQILLLAQLRVELANTQGEATK